MPRMMRSPQSPTFSRRAKLFPSLLVLATALIALVHLYMESSLLSLTSPTGITVPPASTIADFAVAKGHTPRIENIEFDTETNTMPLKKPRLFLHVGPGKMATTTIQDALHADKEIFPVDNFCVVDTNAFQKLSRAIPKQSTEDKIKVEPSWRDELLEMKKTFADCRESNLSVVLSSEFIGLMSEDHYEQTLALLFEGFELTVVVGYRRFYSWAPSVYFQLKKVWTGGYSRFDDDSPANFKEYFSQPHDTNQFKNLLRLYTDSYVDNWSHIVDRKDIVIYNLHEDGNVLKTFYCNILKAEHACKKAIETLHPNTNVGFSTVFDAIAVAAHQKGIVPDTFQRKNAMLLITDFFKDSLITESDLPKDCFEDEDMAYIMEKSKVRGCELRRHRYLITALADTYVLNVAAAKPRHDF